MFDQEQLTIVHNMIEKLELECSHLVGGSITGSDLEGGDAQR